MEFLRELVQIKRDVEMADLFENLGNLGKLGLGSMVDAFKQTYQAWNRKGTEHKNTSKVGNKFEFYSNVTLGKDSETVDGGNIKNFAGLKKAYAKFTNDYPLASIFSVDGKPVALLLASGAQLIGINDKVALAWDFTKISITPEEQAELIKGLNKNGEDTSSKVIVSNDESPGKSSRTVVSKSRYDNDGGKVFTAKYAGFVQTVREITPFVNNLAKTFGSRLDVKLILKDKERESKRNVRNLNQPIAPSEIKLFTDDIKKRLAKYKNSKVESVDDVETFVKKVFGGGLKKIRFDGSTYSAIPASKSIGSTHDKGAGHGGHKYFYNGTMQSLFSGKTVTMEFEADRAESDYRTLYLTVKLVNGTLVPVEASYKQGHEFKKVIF